MITQQRILVVDDDKFNAALMREICETAGYVVLEAHDGFKAIEIANSEIPDLVLLDIMMSQKDGFQVCSELKTHELTKSIPIILVTAVDDLDAKVRGIELGADDYITKPFRMFDLQSRISMVLGNRQTKDGSSTDTPGTTGDQRYVGGYRQLRLELEKEFKRASRYQHALACMLITVDRYSDLFREQKVKEAAELIARVQPVLLDELREVDLLYRIDDDVFMVIMPETISASARIAAERIRAALRKQQVTLTVALAGYPAKEIENPQDMLRAVTDLLKYSQSEEGDRLIES